MTTLLHLLHAALDIARYFGGWLLIIGGILLAFAVFHFVLFELPGLLIGAGTCPTCPLW